MEFKKIRSYSFIALLVAITILFFWILRPYIYPIFWAAVMAVLFRPLYSWILRKFKDRKNWAAGITLILILLIFLIPLAGITSLIIQQAVSVGQKYANQETVTSVGTAVQGYLEWGPVQKVFGEVDVKEKIISWSDSISSFAYQVLATSGQGTAKFIIQFFIMLYTLFFFLRDGDKVLKKIMYLLPLGDKYEKLLYKRFVSTSRATLKGTLLIGLIQGTIGAAAFFIVSIPGSAFWGLIMVILSIIPSLGAAIIMAPAAIILFFTGNIWQAIVVVIFMVVASIIDNFLRGPLVGKDAQMHPLFIFFSTLGGLLAVGITGVIIGPVVTAFLLSMWDIYEQKYKEHLVKDD